jgi:hypothetical protein
MFNTGALYEMQIRPNGRAAADEYIHNGNIWIEGREGSKYTIYLKNNDWRRAQFIVSVDGLDVLDGLPAGIHSRGYVLSPNQSVEIPGWRLNNREAAEFYFSKKSNSYVNQIGGTVANTGVIGCMVFGEWLNASPLSNNAGYYSGNIHSNVAPPILTSAALHPDSYLRSAVSTAATNNFSQLKVGTAFGNAVEHSTQEVNFVRSNVTQADSLMIIYYDSAENLRKMGIQIRTKSSPTVPNPFPGNGSSVGCQPPPSWIR